MRTTSPRTETGSPSLAGRMVSVFISSVPRVRSRPGRAALMAKFIDASRIREWMPAWAVPWGLQARAVGVQVPSTQPRSSPSTP